MVPARKPWAHLVPKIVRQLPRQFSKTLFFPCGEQLGYQPYNSVVLKLNFDGYAAMMECKDSC
jgi:hypothetical protein